MEKEHLRNANICKKHHLMRGHVAEITALDTTTEKESSYYRFHSNSIEIH
jgi:hypothetical protein